MDDPSDSFGKLSLNAKEWRPGQGFAPPSNNNAIAAAALSSSGRRLDNDNNNNSMHEVNNNDNRQQSTGTTSTSSPSRGGSSGYVSSQSRQSSWGESSSQAVDVNGTHYFGSGGGGGGGGGSWETSSRQQQHTPHHPSAAQSTSSHDPSNHNNTSSHINHTNIHTTIPSPNYSQNNNPNNNNRTNNNNNHRSTLRNTLSLPSDDYRHYRDLSLIASKEMEPNDPRHKAVPSSFCRAYCLDHQQQQGGGGENDTNNIIMNNTNMTNQRSSFGYPTCLFRVTSTSDGKYYALRRMDSVRCVSHKIIQNVMNMWMNRQNARLEERYHQTMSHHQYPTAPPPPPMMANSLFDHPNVVGWYKCFISQRALFFMHEYHVGAVTLKERFFDDATSSSSSNNHNNSKHKSSYAENGAELGIPFSAKGGIPLPEPFIWSCLTQLVSAITAVHGSNLAVRTLQLNHILVTREGGPSSSAGTNAMNGSSMGFPKLRFRINCVGIPDILEYEARKSLEDLQMEDMRSLGFLILSMTTGTDVNMNDIYHRNTASSNTGSDPMQQQQQILTTLSQYSNFVRQHYSRELHSLMEALVNPTVAPPSIEEVARSMALRILEEMDGAHASLDGMSGALAGVYESGRALRLMLKLAFVNERPEFGIDKNWSEAGDCYILKLFRDFVFHQADGAGRPVMDLGHVVSSLNKLDAADEEKIVLTSRDGKNILVVSYADVAWCLEKCYQELCSNAVPHPALT